MQKPISSKITLLAFIVLAVSFIVSFCIFAWQEPGQPAPEGNVATPLNTGTLPQSKAGRITATEFYDYNDSNYYLNPNGNSNLMIVKATKLHFQPISQPATATEGDVYFDNTYHKLCYYNGIDWSCMPKPECYCDGDGDGRYSKIVVAATTTCAVIGCSDISGDDCDDNCSSCYPGSLEFTTEPDSHDQNCNGEVDETFQKPDHICNNVTYSGDTHPRAPVSSVEEQCSAYCGFAGGQVGCTKESSYNYSRINLLTCSGEGRIYGNLMSCCKYSARITCSCLEVYR